MKACCESEILPQTVNPAKIFKANPDPSRLTNRCRKPRCIFSASRN